jgi:hypothetical protein
MHDERDDAAALNNAQWCAAVWRSHGLPVETAHGLWFCPLPTPQYYPNFVTAELGADPALQARFIGEIAQAHPDLDLSVRDSFACLDLRQAGLKPLFDARWLWRDAQPAAGGDQPAGWRKIEDGRSLAAWEHAWRGDDEGLERIFPPELLSDPRVIVLGQEAGACGGIAYDAADVLGVTNIFGSRRQFLDALAALEPGKPIVAYEAGGDLASASRNGFQTLGGLRVWIRA